MLSKLMKHEMRASGRILLPVYLLLLLTAVLSCLCWHLSQTYDESTAVTIFQRLTMTAFIITAIGCAVLTLALMVYRFYKNLMTDEGYLMFTLPCSVGQIICSKLLTALIWSVITVLVELVSALIFIIGDVNWKSLFADLPRLFKELRLSAGEVIGYSAEGLLLVVLITLSAYLIFYAAISLGHSFANHKVLLSVVFYIAFNFALQLVSSFGVLFGAIKLIPDELFADGENLWQSFQLIAWGSIVWSALICVVFYLLTHTMLKRRLNLQ